MSFNNNMGIVPCRTSSNRCCVCDKQNCNLEYVQPSLRKSFKPIHPRISNVALSSETTTKLSYQYPHGFQPSESCKPKPSTHPYDFPIGMGTTNSLSYLPPTLPVKEKYPWAMRRYVPSSDVRMADDTIYKMSYAPPGEFVQVAGCNCG